MQCNSRSSPLRYDRWKCSNIWLCSYVSTSSHFEVSKAGVVQVYLEHHESLMRAGVFDQLYGVRIVSLGSTPLHLALCSANYWKWEDLKLHGRCLFSTFHLWIGAAEIHKTRPSGNLLDVYQSFSHSVCVCPPGGSAPGASHAESGGSSSCSGHGRRPDEGTLWNPIHLFHIV